MFSEKLEVPKFCKAHSKLTGPWNAFMLVTTPCMHPLASWDLCTLLLWSTSVCCLLSFCLFFWFTSHESFCLMNDDRNWLFPYLMCWLTAVANHSRFEFGNHWYNIFNTKWMPGEYIHIHCAICMQWLKCVNASWILHQSVTSLFLYSKN